MYFSVCFLRRQSYKDNLYTLKDQHVFKREPFLLIELKVCVPIFFAIFPKGDNFRDFLFAYLEDEMFLKTGSLLKEIICSDVSIVFAL